MNVKKACVALAAACGLFVSVQSYAVVVNFDDLVGAGTVADGYGGIIWNGEWDHYDASQPPYNPSSPAQRIYNSDRANPSTFNFGTDAVFDGAYFAGFPDVSGSNAVHFELYLNGILQFTSGSLLPSATPTFLSSGYGGLVDEVRVISGSGDFYVMDDVTYNANAVPEPSSLALSGLALLGLALVRSRASRRFAAPPRLKAALA